MKVAKKVLALLLTVVMLCSLANAAMAKDLDSGFCGERATWALDLNGTLTIKGNGDMKAYAMGSHADFRNYSTKVKKVVMQKNVLSIGAYAFQGFSALTSVKMEDSVLRIGAHAFSDCTSLTDITLSGITVTINAYAFSNCPALKSIVIPEKVSALNAHTFDGCTGLQSVEIRNATCRFTASDVLPKGVTVIGYKGSTAQEYAEKNGLAFRVIGSTTPEQPGQPATQPTTDTTPAADAGKCPLCGQNHEGFPGSLIGGIHSFIYTLLMLFGLRKAT